MYTVTCEWPDGGDVIEGRAERYVAHYDNLVEAIRDACRWYRTGPNGPVRWAKFYRDGEQVSPRAEIDRMGHIALGVKNPNTGSWRLTSCRPRQDGDDVQ